ncbi:MAG: hypothetical protein DMG05_12245 [Acidobacteria bacterium]|nr:MAG: hypothetical protein DMG05_12245 [Acidobacteriota bacterium]
MNSFLKNPGLAVFIPIIFWGAISIFLTNPKIVGLYHDDGIYVVLSKALASGQGYRIISLPDQPMETKYPPLFPLLLTPVWWLNPVFPSNIIWFKVMVIVCGALFLLLSHQLFVVVFKFGFRNSLFLLALLVTNPVLLSVSQWILAEIPYGFISTATILFFETRCNQEKTTNNLRLLLLALLASSSYLLKTHGIVLVLAITLCFAVKRRYRDLVVYLFFLTPFLGGWFAWISYHAASPHSALTQYYISYGNSLVRIGSLSNFKRLGFLLYQNLKYLVSTLDYFFIPLASIPVAGKLFPIVFIGFLPGLVLTWRRVSLVAGIYLVGFFFCILLLPWHPFRHLVPIVPLILGTVALSVLSIFQNYRTSQSQAGKLSWHPLWALSLGSVLSAILFFNTLRILQALQTNNENYLPSHNAFFDPQRRWQGFEETFQWLRENTQEEDVLASLLDPVYYLYTNRKGMRFWLHNPETYFYPDWASAQPSVGEVSQIIALLKEAKVRWLIRDPICNSDFREGQAVDALARAIVAKEYPRSSLCFLSSDQGHWVYRLDW